MMAEVAFESPQTIAEKLSRYEELFKHRYTERDEGFRIAMQRSSRWYQVPVMSPWPPRRPYNQRRRYQDWDNSHRYGYRSRERGRPPYYSRPRYYDERDRGYHRRYRSRSPHDRRSPRDMSRDPGYRERSRSPFSPGRYHQQHRGYHNSPSPPPHRLPPPPSHHDYTRRSRSRSPHWDRSPRREKPSPGRPELSPPVGRREPPSPVRKEKHGGSVSDDNPPGEPEKAEPQTNPLVDLGFGDSDQKVIPSESDVLDILSSAHAGANEITSQNLKRVQKEGQVQATRKESGRKKVTTADKPLTAPERDPLDDKGAAAVPLVHPSSNLFISHGTTENVLTSLLEQKIEAPAIQPTKGHKTQKRKKAKKRPKIVISDEESGEVERLFPAEHLTWDSSGNTSAVTSETISDVYREPESLILHVDKKFCSKLSHRTSAGSVATSLDTAFLDVGGTCDTNGKSFDTTGASQDTMLTALCSDPSSGKLIIKSEGHSRSGSPVNVEEVVREKKSKKKKKKMKREETGKQLKLKITISRPDTM